MFVVSFGGFAQKRHPADAEKVIPPRFRHLPPASVTQPKFTASWPRRSEKQAKLSAAASTQEVDFNRLGREHESGAALIPSLRDVNVNSHRGLRGRSSASRAAKSSLTFNSGRALFIFRKKRNDCRLMLFDESVPISRAQSRTTLVFLDWSY